MEWSEKHVIITLYILTISFELWIKYDLPLSPQINPYPLSLKYLVTVPNI